MSSDYLQLNTNYVQSGLGTLTFTVPTTGNYNVRCRCTVPAAIASGNGSGEGYGTAPGGSGGSNISNLVQQGPAFSGDQGLGALGGLPGIGAVPATSLGQGGIGQGFLGTNTDGAAAPIAYSPVTSGLTITVSDGVTTLYTSPTLGVEQSEIDFKTSFQATAADTITIVFSSSTASDKTLQAIKANVSIGQGL